MSLGVSGGVRSKVGGTGKTVVWREARGLSTAGFTGSAADGDVAEETAFGPVATARFTQVAGLGQAVVVVVTEFGVGRSTARAGGRRLHVAGFPTGQWLGTGITPG